MIREPGGKSVSISHDDFSHITSANVSPHLLLSSLHIRIHHYLIQLRLFDLYLKIIQIMANTVTNRLQTINEVFYDPHQKAQELSKFYQNKFQVIFELLS